MKWRWSPLNMHDRSRASRGDLHQTLDATDLGAACAIYQGGALRDLACKRVQCDEIWSFCYAKEKNVPNDMYGKYGVGDVWTWTALCQDSKLILCWYVGERDAQAADVFVRDLASRVANRIQLTTDGLAAYVPAAFFAFGKDGVDFAQLVKLYSGGTVTDNKYSPPACIGTKKHRVLGDPDMAAVSTSHVERQNLTMRMGMRRLTRLTNAFSKKIGNLESAVALHFMHYNFCRVHKTLGTTPAVAAGVADHVWTIEEVVGLLGPRHLSLKPLGLTRS